GPANPLLSAPQTRNGKQRGVRHDASSGNPRPSSETSGASIRRRVSAGTKLLGRDGRPYTDSETPITLAYLASREGFSSDQLLADPELNAAFVSACARKGASGTPFDWNRALLRLRKVGRLPKVDIRRRSLTDEQIDPFSFASEIAWRQIESKP